MAMTVKIMHDCGAEEWWEIPDTEPPIALRRSRRFENGEIVVIVLRLDSYVQTITGAWLATYRESLPESAGPSGARRPRAGRPSRRS